MDERRTEQEALEAILGWASGLAGPANGALPAALPALDELAGGPGPEGEPRRPRPELLRGVHLKVRAELGRKQVTIKEALQLGPGSVIDLQKLADDPVDLYVDDLLIARGEVLVVNDCFCIRITEVFAHEGIEEAVT